MDKNTSIKNEDISIKDSKFKDLLKKLCFDERLKMMKEYDPKDFFKNSFNEDIDKANHGCKNSQYIVGNMYIIYRGNIEYGLRYYKLSADQGDHRAQLNVVILLDYIYNNQDKQKLLCQACFTDLCNSETILKYLFLSSSQNYYYANYLMGSFIKDNKYELTKYESNFYLKDRRILSCFKDSLKNSDFYEDEKMSQEFKKYLQEIIQKYEDEIQESNLKQEIRLETERIIRQQKRELKRKHELQEKLRIQKEQEEHKISRAEEIANELIREEEEEKKRKNTKKNKKKEKEKLKKENQRKKREKEENIKKQKIQEEKNKIENLRKEKEDKRKRIKKMEKDRLEKLKLDIIKEKEIKEEKERLIKEEKEILIKEEKLRQNEIVLNDNIKLIDFLKDINLLKLAPLFSNYKINYDKLLTLNKEDLKNLGISIGSRVKIFSKLKDIKKHNEENLVGLQDDRLCVICLDKPKIYATNPCGHLCFCEDCYNLFENKENKENKEKECPLCREPIINLLKIHNM